MNRLTVTLLSATALTFCLSAAGSAQTLGPLVRVASHTIFADCTADAVATQPGVNFPNSAIEPNIAANPAVKGELLIGVQQDRWNDGGSRGLRGALSGDGGAQWLLSLPTGVSSCTGGKYPRATDPWVTYQPDGTAYFFSLAFVELTDPNVNGHDALLISRSSDGGLTWGRPKALITETDPLYFDDKNSITADPYKNGYVYAVWDRLAGPPSAFIAPGGSDERAATSAASVAAVEHDGMARARAHIARNRAVAAGRIPASAVPDTFGPTYFSRTTDGGKNWELATPIYNPGRSAQTIGNVIQVLPNGDVLDFFENISDQGVLDIGYVRSTDHGFSFETRQHAITTMSGVSSIAPQTRTSLRDASILFSVSVAPVTGRIAITFQDTRLDPKAVVNSVFVTESTDNGKTFSEPARIDQTPFNKDRLLRQAFNPTIVAAADGTLVATYYDFRNDTGTVAGQDPTDVWTVSCKPAPNETCTGSAGWRHELRLTPRSFNIDNAPLTSAGLFLGDYFGLATQGTTVYSAFTTATVPGRTTLWSRAINLAP